MDNQIKDKISKAVVGLNNLNTQMVIEDDELSAAIELNEIVIDYLSKRHPGINILLTGLTIELAQLKNLVRNREQEHISFKQIIETKSTKNQ